MDDTSNFHMIAAELEQAKTDLLMWQRLQTAEDRVKRLTAEHAKAKVAHEQWLDAKAKAEEAAKKKAEQDEEDSRFRGLCDLGIVEIPDPMGPGVLKNQYRITYTRQAWDMDLNATSPRTETKAGFAALEDHIFAWIMARQADKLPAGILALCPGDPQEAMSRYFGGLSRGYLNFRP